MGAHGQLVDGDILCALVVGIGEELDGEHARHAELGGDLHAKVRGTLCELGSEIRSGRDGFGADTVFLHGHGDRPDLDLTRGIASDEDRQLAGKRHLLLRHERGASLEQLSDKGLELSRVLGEPHAVTVIAAAAGLEADVAVDLVPEVLGILHRRDGGEGRHWCAELAHAAALHQLVLGVNESARGGLDAVASVEHGREGIGRHVLVVESDGVRALGDGETVRGGVVVPHRHGGNDLGRG